MSAFMQQAQALLDEGTAWAGLGGDALAFVLSRLMADERCLVVVDEADAADRLVRGLRYFHPKPERVELLAGDDNRAYDGFSPSADVPRARLRALARVDAGGPVLVVATARGLLQRLPDRATRKKGSRILSRGDTLERDDLVHWLVDAGYLTTGRVTSVGFYAVRGDVLDLWPNGLHTPIRLDFFDDELEAIRRLDPVTNRAGRAVSRAAVLPNREDRLDRSALVRLASMSAEQVTAQGRGGLLRRRVTEELRDRVRFAGVEAWLPHLVPVVEPLHALRGLRIVVVKPLDVDAALRELERTQAERWGHVDEEERPLPTPAQRYTTVEAVHEGLAGAHRVDDLAVPGRSVDLGARSTDGFGVRGTELSPVVKKVEGLLDDRVRVGLVCTNQRKADSLIELLGHHDLYPVPVSRPESIKPGQLGLLVGDLAQGFLAPSSGWAFIPATALFGGGHKGGGRQDRIHAFFDASVSSLEQIKRGDHVVHRHHGLGLYIGLIRMPVGGVESDFVQLEYRGGDRMYLPVTELAALSRYVPAKESVKIKLDKLGGATWEKRKGRVRDSLLAMAQELLQMQAQRALSERPALPAPGDLYHAFEQSFPFDETPDQAKAIDAVQEDLSGDNPMDRLLCGDVGFGKTEVAMRAAMRMVEAGRQVAVLCPTTVLAYQHAQTFKQRFEGLPVRVGMLSRFNSSSEDTRVKEAIRAHTLDIVVGTTAVLGRGVRFADLGLMVVDEEHRFGVRQKERLKKIRAAVDVLSMSATPIPRTLQMGLSGVRDMSLMATPPKARLSVRTSVARMARTRVRDAVLLELERAGQIFFVHNRVQGIHKVADRIREWVPEARVAVAHGQMEPKKLEEVLVAFVRREYDLLVCTAIMESGVDLPNVNTMLINRADRFGLAQLYQLRGRVGRSNVRASCLLLVPEELTGDARRRVQVMVEHTELGSGFSIAAADLEMRGAGNMLGQAQSGNIDAVGYEVWLELLEQAVQHARGTFDADRVDPEVEVPVDAFLPEHILPDVTERLGWYQRLAACKTADGIDSLLDELELDVGELPTQVRNLAGLLQAKLLCRKLGIQRCSWLKVRVLIEIHPSSRITAGRLDHMVRAMPKRVAVERREGESTMLSIRFTKKEGETPFRFLRWAFVQLGKK